MPERVTVDFSHHHWAELGVVLADGSYLCYDCVSVRGEHRCHGSDGAWKGAPTCTCRECPVSDGQVATENVDELRHR